MITIPLSQLLERGVRIEAAEAVAIVQTLAALPGVPGADTVEIDSAGGVHCHAAGGRPSVHALAALLDRLLPAAGIPAALRYTVARGIGAVEAPPFASIAEFSRALMRFDSADRGQVIRALLARARPARPAPQPAAAAIDLADLPLVVAAAEPLDLPLRELPANDVPSERSRNRVMRAVLIAFLLALSAIAGYVAAAYVLREARRQVPSDPNGVTFSSSGSGHWIIVTGVEELVLVPLPNWPQSFVPQHFTVPPLRIAQL